MSNLPVIAAVLRFFTALLNWWNARNDGREVAASIAKTAEREAEAVAQAPTDRKQLLDSLKAGTF